MNKNLKLVLEVSYPIPTVRSKHGQWARIEEELKDKNSCDNSVRNTKELVTIFDD